MLFPFKSTLFNGPFTGFYLLIPGDNLGRRGGKLQEQACSALPTIGRRYPAPSAIKLSLLLYLIISIYICLIKVTQQRCEMEKWQLP